MDTLVKILISTISVIVTAYIIPGIYINNFGTAVVVAIVLALVNTFIRPILLILTLPINILTLGLFTFVIMGLSVWMTSAIVPGFTVTNFLSAMLFAVVLALVNSILGSSRIL